MDVIHTTRHFASLAALALTAVGSIAIVAAPSAELPATRPLPNAVPSPQLTPEDVVRLQLAALSADAAVPERIKSCYRFASPANRAHTGPIERFARLFESPGYHAMLDAHRFLVGKAIRNGNDAYLLATMVDDRGELSLFRFFLSKQSEPPYADCWMTDTVIRLQLLAPPEPPRPEKSPAI